MIGHATSLASSRRQTTKSMSPNALPLAGAGGPNSWSRERQVIGKAEALPPTLEGGTFRKNHRFIVISLPAETQPGGTCLPGNSSGTACHERSFERLSAEIPSVPG